MKTHKCPELSADEQAMLDEVTVRLIEKAEQAKFNDLLKTEHYLHSADLAGEQLRYVAEFTAMRNQCWTCRLRHLSFSTPAAMNAILAP